MPAEWSDVPGLCVGWRLECDRELNSCSSTLSVTEKSAGEEVGDDEARLICRGKGD
jgi:hypothetical protein